METVKLKEIFDKLLLDQVHSSQLKPYIKEHFGDSLTHAELIAVGQILKAENERDTGAAVFIRDTMGQKPTDKKEISGTADNPFVIKMEGDLSEYAK